MAQGPPACCSCGYSVQCALCQPLYAVVERQVLVCGFVTYIVFSAVTLWRKQTAQGTEEIGKREGKTKREITQEETEEKDRNEGREYRQKEGRGSKEKKQKRKVEKERMNRREEIGRREAERVKENRRAETIEGTHVPH